MLDEYGPQLHLSGIESKTLFKLRRDIGKPQLHLSGIERKSWRSGTPVKAKPQLHLSGIERTFTALREGEPLPTSIAPQWYRKV